MGQMLFLDSMEKIIFSWRMDIPDMHFFVILRAGRLFFFIGQLYYFTQLPAGKSQASWYDFTSWWN